MCYSVSAMDITINLSIVCKVADQGCIVVISSLATKWQAFICTDRGVSCSFACTSSQTYDCHVAATVALVSKFLTLRSEATESNLRIQSREWHVTPLLLRFSC